MRIFIRHRRCDRAGAGLGVPLPLLILPLLFAAPRLRAQQLFIDSIFVHNVNSNCVVQQTSGGAPRFLCPPISPSVCAQLAPPLPASCGLYAGSPSINPDTTTGFGNISNDPHIEFDQAGGALTCSANAAAGFPIPQIPSPSDEATNICNGQVYLCASIGYDLSQAPSPSGGPPSMAVDTLQFEIFQYHNGSNPLDPSSTPPLRTFFVDNVGFVPSAGCGFPYVSGYAGSGCQDLGPYCVPWDGSINLQGFFGKTNGQYGFRAIVTTNETQSVTGNIVLTNTRAYPSGATRDAAFRNCPLTTILGSTGSFTFGGGSIALSGGEIVTGSTFSATLNSYSGPTGSCASNCGTFSGVVNSTAPGQASFNGSFDTSGNTIGTVGGTMLGASAPNGGLVVSAGGTVFSESGNFSLVSSTGSGTGSSTMTVTAANAQSGPISNGSGGFALAAAFSGGGCVVPQQPITVNVVDVHVVRSSPTLVGKLTPVAAEPYNITYRLSEDATMYLFIDTVTVAGASSSQTVVRHLVNGLPRVGEGYPGGNLQNGDAWDGREDNGDFAPPGTYLAYLQASNADQYGMDVSAPFTYPLAIDPLQVTDIAVTPLAGGSTSLAVVGYTLTEPATTFMDIYPPGTQFCPNLIISGQTIFNPLASVNNPLLDVPGVNQSAAPPKNFYPVLGPCPSSGLPTPIAPIRHIVQSQASRIPVLDFWDGRDGSGNLLADGNYVYVLYGELPSQNGFPFNGNAVDSRIWTSVAKTGLIPIARGLVGVSQISPISSVVGSSPPVSGINPFQFGYTLSRDATVKVNIFNESASTIVVRHLILGETRPGNFPNVETWNGTDDSGDYVSSGTYMVELTAWDPAFPTFVSTTTALFPVDMFRVINARATPLLSGTSAVATVSYELSNSMYVGINIYPPGTAVHNINTDWPPCGQVVHTTPCPDVTAANGIPNVPIYQIFGMRAGQLLATDQWAGITPGGLMVPDGQYPFTLIAQSTVTTIGNSTTTYATDRIVGLLTIARGLISFPVFEVDPTLAQTFFSSETIELDPFSIKYELTRPSSVTISIIDVNGRVIRHLIAGEERNGSAVLSDVWDGRDDSGNFPAPGFFTIVMTAEDVASEASSLSLSTAVATVSYIPIQIYDLAVSPVNLQSPSARIFYQVSEPMKVAIKIYRPGTGFSSTLSPPVVPLTPDSVSLVKVLVSFQPARQKVETDWDGTDLTFSKVPDGTYRFTIVGSTDSTAIDSITGDVLKPSAISIDQFVDDLPVTRNASLDPQADFDQNTFAYPNPASGPTVTFSIFMPFQGDIFMRIYTISGELVFEHDFGEVPPTFKSNGPLTYVWSKDNEAGRGVAKGIYYVVFHAEETLGNKNIVQTVKKVLIP